MEHRIFRCSLTYYWNWNKYYFSCTYALYCKLFGDDHDVALFKAFTENSTSQIGKRLASITLVKLQLFAVSIIVCLGWFTNRNHRYAFSMLTTINSLICVYIIKSCSKDHFGIFNFGIFISVFSLFSLFSIISVFLIFTLHSHFHILIFTLHYALVLLVSVKAFVAPAMFRI